MAEFDESQDLWETHRAVEGALRDARERLLHQVTESLEQGNCCIPAFFLLTFGRGTRRLGSTEVLIHVEATQRMDLEEELEKDNVQWNNDERFLTQYAMRKMHDTSKTIKPHARIFVVAGNLPTKLIEGDTHAEGLVCTQETVDGDMVAFEAEVTMTGKKLHVSEWSKVDPKTVEQGVRKGEEILKRVSN